MTPGPPSSAARPRTARPSFIDRRRASPAWVPGALAWRWRVGDDRGVSSGSGLPAARPGWVRDVPTPRSLAELRGPLTGRVGLPIRLFWSGPDPRGVRWDLADPVRRRDLYEILLVEGTVEDIRELVNGVELVRLWDEMYLPPWVRAAWRVLIESAGAAA
jgi:hypothetical protein